MEDFTIFTPTYNRAPTLGRVYNSLVNQTCKKFEWLIVDDGSTDNTRELVERWQNEKKIAIEYCYRKNGGKQSAMRLAYEVVRTKYIIEIDSDDELKPEAVETFKDEWQKIIAEGKESEFGDIAALTYFSNGKLNGNFSFPVDKYFIDSNWHEMVLKYKNNNEHIVCWQSIKLKECADIPNEFWLSDKVNYLGESLFWARLGKKYKTRYINKCLRIYYCDGGESLLRNKNETLQLYNNIVTTKYFLDENLDFFTWNPKYFFNLILKFIVSGIELELLPFTLLKQMHSFRFKFAYFLFFPLGVIAWSYFKFVKKRFWFTGVA